jgi:L,D-transpeptidase ErfK/SrfK
MHRSLQWIGLVGAATVALSAQPARQVLWGEPHDHLISPGDSVGTIAARVGLYAPTLAQDNRLTVNARLHPDHVIRVNNVHAVPHGIADGIVINVPQRMLFVYAGGVVTAAYPVAAGQASWRTPLGTFAIAAKEVDPTWDVPPSIQREMAAQGKPVVTKVGPGGANPLGDRWLGIAGTGIGIHGTNVPAGIYRLGTHGCVRLHPEDIRDLYDRVDVGAVVRIIYEPVLVAVQPDARVWVEVHADVYRRTGDLLARALWLIDEEEAHALVDPAALRACVAARSGRACEVTLQPQ